MLLMGPGIPRHTDVTVTEPGSAPIIRPLTKWMRLLLYVASLLVSWHQVRVPVGDQPRGRPFPRWLRTLLLGEGAGMLTFGGGLLVAPLVIGPAWPWTLTALTGRAIGAWLVGIGFAAVHASWENDLSRTRPLEGGYAVFAVLQLVALARYSSELNWSTPAAW